MIGPGLESEAVFDLIGRVANLATNVLITGESGTGKELIARAIHSSGNRASRPFVAVSCGAIPDSLIDAELFGSERGAYTGAAARRTGYFEEAGEGTLLLDEVGELTPHMQVKLLRVLQQREFMRLGSSKVIPLYARVLFATNRNLRQMVMAGTFREDLYYRMNVVAIHSRPLRERTDEIEPLALHFLEKYSGPGQKEVLHIEPRAMAVLRRYSWPGNIRELENVMQRAIVMCDDDTVRLVNLPEEILPPDTGSTLPTPGGISFEEQLQEYKIKLVTDAVRECHGNKTLAAQSLNISRTYLHRLIREPETDRPHLKIA